MSSEQNKSQPNCAGTAMTGMGETELRRAIAHVRDPHRLENDKDRMDLIELGARRFAAWLDTNGYVISQPRGKQ